MDETKRFDRLLKLFFLMQSKSVVTMAELQTRFEKSRRTIYRDIKGLESAGVPIVYEPATGYSIMEGFRIQPSRFSQEEVLSLTISEKIMQQHQTQFVKQHFDSALIKIKGSFLMHQKDELVDLADKLHVSDPLIAAGYLPNIIDTLLKCTIKKITAEIAYIKSSEIDPVTRKIEPVGLFFESNFWYVLAFCHLRRDYRNFRLDRVKKVVLSAEPFTSSHLTINELRNKNNTDTITKISIKVDRQFAHYLFWEKQSFGFKSEITADNDVFMHFDCPMHPTSFVRWFMKFADLGEIIEPANLQTELLTILNTALERQKERI